MATENGNGNGAMLPEAPASATAKMISKNGIEWLVTTRNHTVQGLLDNIAVMEDHLLKRGWQPAAHRNGHAPPSVPTNGAANANGGGDAPTCEYHGTMKPSQFGGFYCTAKMADGSYCKETAKA